MSSFQFVLKNALPVRQHHPIRRETARNNAWKRNCGREPSDRSLWTCSGPAGFQSTVQKYQSRIRPRSWATGGSCGPHYDKIILVCGRESESVRTFSKSTWLPRQSDSNDMGSNFDDGIHNMNTFSYQEKDDVLSKHIFNNPVIFGSMSEADGVSMRKNAEALLQCPIGKVEVNAWYDADDAIKWWISQRTEESVVVSMNLLKRFIEEAKVSEDAENNLLSFFQDTVLVELVFNWFCVWKEHHIKWTPARLLDTLRKYEASFPDLVRISWKIDAYLINAMSHGCDPKEVAPLANELLNQFFDHRERQRHNYLSNYLSNITMRLWGRSNLPEAVERSEAIYFRMKAEAVRLDIVTFNTLMDVYAQAGLAEEAELLLEALSRDYGEGVTKIRPDETTLSSAIYAWSKSRLPNADERAQKLLNRVMDPLDVLGQLDITPGLFSHNHLLGCWARAGTEDAAKQALQYLAQMKNMGLEPDHVSYGIVTNALAKSGDLTAAENLIRDLCMKYEDRRDDHLRPTVQLFTTLMTAWCKSVHPGREKKMLEIFDWTKKLFEEGVVEKGPDTWMHNLILRSIVQGNEDDRVTRADEHLQIMMSLGLADGWSYSEVIIAYLENLRDPNDLIRVEHILEAAFKAEDVVLSVKCPARVILQFAKANTAAKADAWLHRVFDRAEAGLFPKDESPAPSLLGAVVASWYRVADSDTNACTKAEALVNRMIDLESKGMVKEGPDHEVLKTIVILYSRSFNPERANRAFAILQQMRQRASKGQLKPAPDAGTVYAVIAMFVESKNLSMAETVFRNMTQDFLTDNRRARPERNIFNYLLKAMADSSDKRAFEMAYSLLKDMLDMSQNHQIGLKPNKSSFHYVLRAANQDTCHAGDVEKLIRAMNEAYSNGNASCKPTYFTYSMIIKLLCKGGKPSEADAYLREFCDLYDRGELRSSPPPALFDSVIESWDRFEKTTQSKDQAQQNFGVLFNILGESSDVVIEPTPPNVAKPKPQIDARKRAADIRNLKALVCR